MAEHRDLGAQTGDKTAAGPEFGDRGPEVLAVLVAFEHGFNFDAHDALDDFRISAVDGELESSAKKRIGRFAGDGFKGQNPVAAGGFGVADHFLDDVLDMA